MEFLCHLERQSRSWVVRPWSHSHVQEPCNGPRTAGTCTSPELFSLCSSSIYCVVLHICSICIYVYIYTVYTSWNICIDITYVCIYTYNHIYIYIYIHIYISSVFNIQNVQSQCQGFAAVHVVDWSRAQPGRGSWWMNVTLFLCWFICSIYKCYMNLSYIYIYIYTVVNDL